MCPFSAEHRDAYRGTLTPPSFISFSTTALLAIEVSSGVGIAGALGAGPQFRVSSFTRCLHTTPWELR